METVMSSTAVVWEKIVRYQKYLDKCMNVAKVNEKHLLTVLKKLDMLPITLEHLQDTGIGKTVNGYRKHCYETVRYFARRLVTKWKQLVQHMTEAVSDTECSQSTHDDLVITADMEKKVSVGNYESQMDKQLLRTSASKRKHWHAGGNHAAAKRHSSSFVKYNEFDEQDTDEMLSNPCVQTKVSAASLSLPLSSDHSGESSNCSEGQSLTQVSAFMSESTGHQKVSVGDSSVNKTAGTSDTSRHEKHSKLTTSKSTARYVNVEKYHSDSKASMKISKSALCKKESHITPTESVSTDVCGSASDGMLHESGRVLVPDGQGEETHSSKSVRKSASKTSCTAVCKDSEKKSHIVSISDRHIDSDASVPSTAKMHHIGHASKDPNQAVVKTFTTSDDVLVDDSEYSGMTFEQMLNYDNHDVVVRKKKGSVHKGSKCSKVPTSTTHSTSLVSPSVTKHSSKPSSGHTSCSLHNSMSAEIDELDRSRLSRQPVIPHPASQLEISSKDIMATLSETVDAYTEKSAMKSAKEPSDGLTDSSDDMWLGHTKRNSRTQVYSGRKVHYLTELPTLFQACLRVLMDNIDALEYVGPIPYEILKPVLQCCTPSQLYNLEDFNPHLLGDTDELWEVHCKRDFRTSELEEFDSWREQYLRLSDEREAKLRSVTESISRLQAQKSAPVRHTKLAYINSDAKPPREVLRRQMKNRVEMQHSATVNGKRTAAAAALVTCSTASPKKRHSMPTSTSSLGRAESPPQLKGGVKMVAPMMAKTLRQMKGMRR